MLEYFCPKLNECLVPYFTYRTNKYIAIEVPIVGIVHRLVQIAALCYVVFNMVTGSAWAYNEVPVGQVNAWVEVGGYKDEAKNLNPYTSKTYCSNPEYAYDYGSGWVYGTPANPPICNSPNEFTITEKTTDSVFITTAYIENNEYGFPCADAGGTADALTCTAQYTGGEVVAYANGQCVCTGPKNTYYPLASEKMVVAVEHFYNTRLGVKLSGSSINNDVDPELDTTVKFVDKDAPDGVREVEYMAGEVINISVADMLFGAKHAYCKEGSVADGRDGTMDGECNTGITLDESNSDQGQEDQSDSSAEAKYPSFRTTGASVTVSIYYDNLQANGRAKGLGPDNEKYKVKATVEISVQTMSWASVGGSTTFKAYPTGEIGAETWELSSRYKQGVMVNFAQSGEIYSFNFFYLINVIVEGLVLLGFAATVADNFAFYCLGGGQSTILRNKRCEKVSKKSEFAEVGLKAALGTQMFNYFDRDNNGVIESVDIVRAFAAIEKSDGSGPALTPEQAHAIATAIMSDADTDGSSFGSLDFAEFMTCVEGDATNFTFFLDKVDDAKGLSVMEDYNDCLDAFKNAREVAEEKKAKRAEKRRKFSERYPNAKPHEVQLGRTSSRSDKGGGVTLTKPRSESSV